MPTQPAQIYPNTKRSCLPRVTTQQSQLAEGSNETLVAQRRRVGTLSEISLFSKILPGISITITLPLLSFLNAVFVVRPDSCIGVLSPEYAQTDEWAALTSPTQSRKSCPFLNRTSMPPASSDDKLTAISARPKNMYAQFPSSNCFLNILNEAVLVDGSDTEGEKETIPPASAKSSLTHTDMT
ncbi:hypothetical protein M758_8G181800 [Ceratodon purpureus]|nr:hypothetical protein M758_8G181800 [Ceratodon purpureus]